MRRCVMLWLTGAWIGATSATGLAADYMYAIAGPKGTERELGVERGKVRWVKGAAEGRDWRLHEVKEGWTIRLLSEDRWNGWYVTCDHSGKDKRVFLSRKPTPGSYWTLGNVGGPNPTAISASKGKFKGWFLGVGDKAEKLKDVSGDPYFAYQMILIKKPERIPMFRIFPVAP
jgi:hypothetical protein